MGTPKAPNAPDLARDYDRGMQVYLKYLPKLLREEQQARNKWDPKRIQENLRNQERFGPRFYDAQLAALRQLDPQGFALRNQFGANISRDLARGYTDPMQNRLYGQLGLRASQALQRGALDPQQLAAYRTLGSNVVGDLNRRTQMDPQFAREVEQSIRSGQSARGNVSGNAAVSAEALYKGQRAQQLYQQRLGNTGNFLQLQTPMAGAMQAAQSVYGMQSPTEKTYAQAGGFMGLPSPIQQIQGIQGVNPDRASAYVNPNAGYQGAQYGLQNYQNQLSQYGMQGPNPWMAALGGAASGAAAGGTFGPYGAIIGGAVGGLGGGLGAAYSDARIKKDIRTVGQAPSGLPIVEFRFKDKPDKLWRGVLAQDVLKVKPEAVRKDQDGLLMVDYSMLDVELEVVGKGDE